MGTSGAGNPRVLRLMTQRDGSVYVHGLRECEVVSLADALAVLRRGQRNRMVAETQLNRGSSRSHSVLTIKLVRAGADKDRDGIVAKVRMLLRIYYQTMIQFKLQIKSCCAVLLYRLSMYQCISIIHDCFLSSYPPRHRCRSSTSRAPSALTARTTRASA